MIMQMKKDPNTMELCVLEFMSSMFEWEFLIEDGQITGVIV